MDVYEEGAIGLYTHAAGAAKDRLANLVGDAGVGNDKDNDSTNTDHEDDQSVFYEDDMEKLHLFTAWKVSKNFVAKSI